MFNSVTEDSFEISPCTCVQVFSYLRNRKSSNGLAEHTGKSLTISPLLLTTAIFSPSFSLLYDLTSFFLLSDVSHENF